MHLLLRFLLLGFVSFALGNFWVFQGATNTGQEILPGYLFFNVSSIPFLGNPTPTHPEITIKLEN